MNRRREVTNHVARIMEAWAENTAELATLPEAEVEEMLNDMRSLQGDEVDKAFVELLDKGIKRARVQQAEWEKEDNGG